MKLIIEIEPMGAVRMTGRGKWVNPDAIRYLSYKSTIAWEAKLQAKLETPIHQPVLIQQVTFVMPIPKGGRVGYTDPDGKRRTRKVQPGDYHTVKPDIDNLFKGLTDSFKGIIWKDDSLICEIGRQTKIYGDNPRVEIEITEVG